MDKRAWSWKRIWAEGKRWKILNMSKKRNRRSLKKDLDHEDGSELKDKDGRSWPWKRRRARRSWKKELDHEVGEELKEKDGRFWPWKKEEQEIMEERAWPWCRRRVE
jgi:hypothetical protein